MTITDALHWRYATKRMNGQKIPQQQLDRILEAVRLAPSSYGLQPYSVLVIEDRALRERLRPLAFDQPQITECSHLLVFAAWSPISERHVDELIRLTADERGMSLAELESYGNAIKDSVRNYSSPLERFQWAAKQAYLALGTALVAAAAERIDASPMEGFDAAGLDALLRLDERGLRSAVLLALVLLPGRFAASEPLSRFLARRASPSNGSLPWQEAQHRQGPGERLPAGGPHSHQGVVAALQWGTTTFSKPRLALVAVRPAEVANRPGRSTRLSGYCHRLACSSEESALAARKAVHSASGGTCRATGWAGSCESGLGG